MSHNQSRADTREAFQYRRTGRSGSFNQHLGGNKGSGGGGGGRGAAPPVSSTTNPSLSSNRRWVFRLLLGHFLKFDIFVES